jgi:YgiT-type zinc finger domain-containing protein
MNVPMETKPTPICGEHKAHREWRQTSFTYEEDGISITVNNISAWVCPVNGEASFTPQTADELTTTVRTILEPARKARATQPVLTPYIVLVGLCKRIHQSA